MKNHFQCAGQESYSFTLEQLTRKCGTCKHCNLKAAPDVAPVALCTSLSTIPQGTFCQSVSWLSVFCLNLCCACAETVNAEIPVQISDIAFGFGDCGFPYRPTDILAIIGHIPALSNFHCACAETPISELFDITIGLISFSLPDFLKYRVGQKSGPVLKVYNFCIWWCSKVIHISNCSVLYLE